VALCSRRPRAYTATGEAAVMAVLTAGVRNADVVSLTPLKMVKLRAGAYLELLP
jgi:hypothetical protein